MKSQNFKIFFLVVGLIFTGHAYSVEYQNSEIEKNIENAYGVAKTLVLWKKELEPVYFNEDSPLAPKTPFDSKDPLPKMFDNAANICMRVSGIKFSKTKNEEPSDSELKAVPCNESQWINKVEINWKELEDFKATAGSGYCPSTSIDKGWYEFTYGKVDLSKDSDFQTSYEINPNFDTDRTLTHEIGHIIGFGHSNEPLSVMYANPYNFTLFPQPDDIKATQVMYGKNSQFVDRASLGMEWGIPQRFTASELFDTYPVSETTRYPGFYFYDASASEWRTDLGKFSIFAESNLKKGSFHFYGWVNRFESQSDAEKERIYQVFLTDEYGIPIFVTSHNQACLYWREVSGDNYCRIAFGIPISSNKLLSIGSKSYRVFILSNKEIVFEDEIVVDANPTNPVNDNPEVKIKINNKNQPNTIELSINAKDDNSQLFESILWGLGAEGQLSQEDAYHKWPEGVDNIYKNTGDITYSFSHLGWHQLMLETYDAEVRYGRDSDGQRDDDNVNEGGGYAGGGFQTLSKIVLHAPLSEYPIRTYISDTNNVYIEQPTKNYLSAGNVIKIKDPSVSSAEIWYATTTDNDWASNDNSLSFSINDFINIVTKIEADELDIGAEIEFYVAIKSKTESGVKLYFMNDDRTLSKWNGSINRLEPVWVMKESENLPAYRRVWDFEVIQGQMNAGEHTFFVGYRNKEIDGPIHVHPKGFKITVN